jgi:hypothetical protein
MMSRRVIYIASRAHSGSTFLDLLLSGHPRIIGLGEVYSLFDPVENLISSRGRLRCSCGAPMRECTFWGPTTEVLRQNQPMKPHEMYRTVLDAFYDHFGEEAIPVDVSKTLEGLQHLRRVEDIKVEVLFLIRDVRPWVISMREDRKRRDDLLLRDLLKRYGWKTPLEYVNRTVIKYYWQWSLLNRQTQRYLKNEGLSSFQLGYEEIALYPEMMMGRICDFIGLDLTDEMLSLEGSESHIIKGNRMRSQKDKLARVFYDNRWFYRGEWYLPSVVFPFIMGYNTREVYGNTRDYLW